MNYNILIKTLTESGGVWTASTLAPISGDYIIDIDLDPKAVSADNFLKIRGRKAKVVLAWDDIVKNIIQSIPLHSAFRNTYLACLMFIYLDGSDEPVFIGSVRNDTLSIDEEDMSVSFYCSDALDTFIDISQNAYFRLQSYDNKISVPGLSNYPFSQLFRDVLYPFSNAFGSPVIEGQLNIGDVMATNVYYDTPIGGYTYQQFREQVDRDGATHWQQGFFELVRIWNDQQDGRSRFVCTWFYGWEFEANVFVRVLVTSVNHDNPFVMQQGQYLEYNATSYAQIALTLHQSGLMPTASTNSWINVRELTSPDSLKTIKYEGTDFNIILDPFQIIAGTSEGYNITAPLDFSIVTVSEGEHTGSDLARACVMANRLSLESRISSLVSSAIFIKRALLPSQADSGNLTGATELTDNEIFDLIKEGNYSQLNKESFAVMTINQNVKNLLNAYYSQVSGAFCYRLTFDTNNNSIGLLDKILIDNKPYFIISITDIDDNGFRKVIAVGSA